LYPDIPSLPIDEELDDPGMNEDFEDPNDRRPMRLLDSRRQADGELSDSDDEGEGGRRNHGHYRDQDDEPNGTHKFGLGGGILNTTSMATHGAGPSGHTTAVRILKSNNPDTMDVDSPDMSTDSGPVSPSAAALEIVDTTNTRFTPEAMETDAAKNTSAENPSKPDAAAGKNAEEKMAVDSAPATPAP
jgi:histone deacetylase 1/2